MKIIKRRILVTGGSGFLGTHLLSHLRNMGCDQVCAPRSADYDLVDKGDTARLYRDEQPELVFHLAAKVGGIGANERNPGLYFHDNLLMGVNILEQARSLASMPKIVLVGTICAYPKFAPIPFREDDLWAGYPEETNAPYGVAKKSLIVMADAYRRQYGLPTICLLPVNLYGPNDNFDLESSHVIPAMIRKFLEAKESESAHVKLWGDGSPTREFLFVDDCARALSSAAEKYEAAEPVNIGAGFEVSIRDLANKISQLVGYRGDIVWDTTRPNGQPRRMLETSRAKRQFGFTASTSLDEGLAKTIAWYTSTTR